MEELKQLECLLRTLHSKAYEVASKLSELEDEGKLSHKFCEENLVLIKAGISDISYGCSQLKEALSSQSDI